MRSLLRQAGIGLAGLAVLTSGCSGFTYSGEDVRVKTTGDTVYLLARTTGVSRNLCAGLGGDAARGAAKQVDGDGRTMQVTQLDDCYTIRHVIVCSDGDGACLAQSEKHRTEEVAARH